MWNRLDLLASLNVSTHVNFTCVKEIEAMYRGCAKT